jgi:hypothetical protein
VIRRDWGVDETQILGSDAVPAVSLRDERCQGHDGEPCCGHLDRERDPVEMCTESFKMGSIGLVDDPTRPHETRPIDEQLHG